ncbi:hypothetical protein DERP_004031 [Dermatophagoides pteronyssinus]|uniref:Uncharacterized protein n=1 Tax=Dermatophagoides pteronyssinus TaxID=6956 RepID=A0ABQ8J8K1_DERPT|nr:hypothetical protein DERP_004031 [Dermatophagoides pteronyssinus]
MIMIVVYYSFLSSTISILLLSLEKIAKFSGFIGGGGRGIDSQTLKPSYINHCAAVNVPIIMIRGIRPFQTPIGPNLPSTLIQVDPRS